MRSLEGVSVVIMSENDVGQFVRQHHGQTGLIWQHGLLPRLTRSYYPRKRFHGW